jgi:hypothetical protein
LLSIILKENLYKFVLRDFIVFFFGIAVSSIAGVFTIYYWTWIQAFQEIAAHLDEFINTPASVVATSPMQGEGSPNEKTPLKKVWKFSGSVKSQLSPI